MRMQDLLAVFLLASLTCCQSAFTTSTLDSMPSYCEKAASSTNLKMTQSSTVCKETFRDQDRENQVTAKGTCNFKFILL